MNFVFAHGQGKEIYSIPSSFILSFYVIVKNICVAKNDHKCLVSVLLLDTVEQPIIVSDFTSLRRSQFKVKLKRTVFAEKK